MSSDKDSCKARTGISFKCMHSSEAIQMLLSHAPLRFSIKEISGMIDFHRNTVRPAVRDLLNRDQIHQFGKSSYYGKTVSEHYRDIARSIYNAPIRGMTESMKKDLLRATGRNLVMQNLAGIVDENYTEQFDHDNLVEAMLHLKMSYPFTDMEIITETKETRRGTKEVEVVRPDLTFHVNPDKYESDDEVDLTISPCLCMGEEKLSYVCEMVTGALEGGISSACNAEVRAVEHLHCSDQSNDDEENSCTYYIHASLTPEEQQLSIKAKEIDTMEDLL